MSIAQRDWHALIQRLATQPPASSIRWGDWDIAPVSGGANNLLYRVADSAGTFAIKFAIRDERDRAGREAAAMQAVEDAGLSFGKRSGGAKLALSSGRSNRHCAQIRDHTERCRTTMRIFSYTP